MLYKNQPNIQRFSEHIHRYWFMWFIVLYGVFVGLPWLAPLLMQIGAVLPGKIIYWAYSFVCHQLPERSFFLFGQKAMYSLAEIQYRYQQTVNPAVLRQYIGDPGAGWKVAWSDRMAAMYTSMFLFALLWWPFRRKIRSLHLYGLVLLALPMVVDGTSHFISDLSGLNQGFRCTNTWLVTLTQNAFPGWFYYGDAIGSFNSWMRLVTGALFGLGVVWFLFPIIERHILAENLLLQARRGLRDRLLQGNLNH
jgi:uncharacterized membrane protein